MRPLRPHAGYGCARSNGYRLLVWAWTAVVIAAYRRVRGTEDRIVRAIRALGGRLIRGIVVRLPTEQLSTGERPSQKAGPTSQHM